MHDIDFRGITVVPESMEPDQGGKCLIEGVSCPRYAMILESKMDMARDVHRQRRILA